MQTSQLEQCSDCGSLRTLYDQVVCSIYQLIKNKWVGHTYNTDAYFDDVQYGSLVRLKRVLFKRLYNQSYPNDCISNQEIITLASKILYKQNDCPRCPCEIFEDPTTSTSTTTLVPPPVCYSYSVSGMFSSAESIVDYTDCNGDSQTVIIEGTNTITICAQEDTVAGDDIIIIKGGLCG